MVKKSHKSKRVPAYRKKSKVVKSLDEGSISLKGLLQQALALHQAGRFKEAEILYRKILSAEPNHAAALNFRGLLAYQTGESNLAVELISKALRAMPDYVDAHSNLGVILNDQGKLEEAIASFLRALALKPDYAEVHSNLGNAYKDLGKLDYAVLSFRKAIALKPNSAELYFNLGNVLRDQGKLDEALACFRQALALRPNYVDAYMNLGSILKGQGRLEESVASYRQVLALDQGNAAAYYNLGNVLKIQGKREEAVESYRRSLVLDPDSADAHYNLGNVLRDQGKLEVAVASYRRALALKPDYAEVHNDLGVVFNEQGRLDEAIDSFRQALAVKPDHAIMHSNLLTCLNYLPEKSPFSYLDEARRYGKIAAGKVRVRFSDWNCNARPERLRIGMVSGDFRNHPVGYFLENVLVNINPARIDLVAYPTYHLEDDLTERIRSIFAAWKPLVGMNDAAAANLIHTDGPHILLDLSGHTRHNRLPVFAWKPAPVQATWLGYFASTGISEMDYLVADPVSVPASQQEQFTEKVWYLPDTRMCFSIPALSEDLAPGPLPALGSGFITFGCFQHLSKINDEVLTVWSRILKALPQARLRLQTFLLDSLEIQEQLKQRLVLSGIGLQQVRFEKQVSRLDYLKAHAQIDIILDTFPFSGGTTTCEALWMGVPTVTLAGNRMLARQGASLLACAGLTGWIAESDDEYVTKAIAHATDLDNLARLRAGLRQQVLASPLFDGSRFAKNFEAALWGMWRQFQDEQ